MPYNTDEPIDKTPPAQSDFAIAKGFHYDASGDEVIVAAFGEVDIANVSTLDSMLRTAVPTKKPIRIDLTHCTYLDSTLINSIMNVIAKRQVALRISVASETIRRVFEIVGLDRVVPIDYT